MQDASPLARGGVFCFLLWLVFGRGDRFNAGCVFCPYFQESCYSDIDQAVKVSIIRPEFVPRPP